MSHNPDFLTIAQLTEDEARDMLEAMRWPNGAVCPHCESTEAYKITPKSEASKTRPGLYKCASCRKQFTVTVGTIFEGSRIAINKWLIAIYLMCASKKGVSAHQLHRQLKVTYKTAWFMCHRIRLAMTQEPMATKISGIVEADETYIGGKEKNKHASKRTGNTRGRSTESKTPVFALVERGGEIRARKMKVLSSFNLKDEISKHVEPNTRIMTDQYSGYAGLATHFQHEAVDHTKREYVRGDAHTNTLEGWFSLLKRGVNGTFHHVSEQHLDRYVDEFTFRYNRRKMSDGERMVSAIKLVGGKRLIYKSLVKTK